MKILMIAPEPFFQSRGTPISVYQRLLGLSFLGYQVDLLTYHIGEDLDIPGVVIHRNPRVPFMNSIKPGPSWVKLVLDPLLFIKAFFMLMMNRYDVIHSHEEASFFAAVLAKLFGVQHLFDVHSSLPKQLSSFRYWGNFFFVRIFEALERATLRSSDAIITIGGDLYDTIVEICPGCNIVKIENLPIQAIIEEQSTEEVESIKNRLGLNGKHTIVYTGTFAPYQGLDMLIDSAEIVVSENADTLFLMVGGNKQEIDYYRDLVGERNLESHFQFTGGVPAMEVPAYLELATALVSPRLVGLSIPLKIYSYMASGKPVVATNIGAHTLALNEDLAILTDTNAEDFAQGILKLIDDPQLSSQLASDAQRYVEENYGVSVYRRNLKQIYQSLEADQVSQVQASPSREPN